MDLKRVSTAYKWRKPAHYNQGRVKRKKGGSKLLKYILRNM